MRGQAHTLEGFVAALVILSGVTFALQATAVTPLTASTSNQHIENQQHDVTTDLLTAAAANDSLVPTLLYWNTSRGAFRDSDARGVYANGGPPTTFGRTLNRTFDPERLAFNVYVGYRRPDGSGTEKRMVYMGSASDNSISASHTVTVFDDDPITDTSTNVSSAAASGDFYASDVDPDGPIFNVMEVRVVVWRI